MFNILLSFDHFRSQNLNRGRSGAPFLKLLNSIISFICLKHADPSGRAL